MAMTSHGNKTMFYSCCNLSLLCLPDAVSQYLWHANHPGFACASAHAQLQSSAWHLITQMLLAFIIFGMNPRLTLQWNRQEINHQTGLALLASDSLIVNTYHIMNTKLISSMSHSWPQHLKLKIRPLLLQ